MKTFQGVATNMLLILVGVCLGRSTVDCTQEKQINEEIKLSNTETKFVSDEVYYKNQAYIDSLHAAAEITR